MGTIDGASRYLSDGMAKGFHAMIREWRHTQGPDAEGRFDPAVFLTIALGVVTAALLVTAF